MARPYEGDGGFGYLGKPSDTSFLLIVRHIVRGLGFRV